MSKQFTAASATATVANGNKQTQAQINKCELTTHTMVYATMARTQICGRRGEPI